jgi:hypothetical protein
MPRSLPVREFVYGDVIGLALLESRNGFPAYYGENNADTYPKL